MPWGMQILTTDGMQNVADMRSARLIQTHASSAAAGNVAVPGFDIAKGFIFLRGASPFHMDVNWNAGQGKCFWSGNSANVSFTLFFFLRG